MGAQFFQYRFSVSAFNANQQLAFVGKVEWVQAQQLAKTTHCRFNGQLAFHQFNATPAGGGELMGDGIHATARSIAQGFNAGAVTQGLDKRRQHRAVALQFTVQPQPFA
ncbi:hypothetical protein D3C86_1961310 [compost metagenome]